MFDVFYQGLKPNRFAHEKYAESIDHARVLCRTRYFWWITYLADLTDWDFLWEPPPWQNHQRHAWPSQWQKDSGVYLIPKQGFDQTNYHASPPITRRSCSDNWVIPPHIDPLSVDMTWHADPQDAPYRYHFPSQWQQAGGVQYVTPGALDIKLVDAFITRATPQPQHWTVPDYIDHTSVDFSWHPSALEPACNYHFQVKLGWDRVGGPEYRNPSSQEWQYLDCLEISTRHDTENWFIPEWIDPASVDFTWRPNPTSPPYIYEFPVEWGWNHVGGPEYRTPGAEDRKYVDHFVARTLPDPANFEIHDDLDNNDDVFRWRPDPTSPPYIYVFGNQWWPAEKRTSAVYKVPGAKDIKFMPTPRCQRKASTVEFTSLKENIEFDMSWEPDPNDPPYHYVFGNQWYPAEIMPTVEYSVPGATEKKYMESPRATLPQRHDNHWHTIEDCEWDYAWIPDPGDPPYIYVFGNQWWPAEKYPTVTYTVPGATEHKYMTEPRAILLPQTEPWHVPPEIDTSTVDFSWRPDPMEPPYVYHFGTEYQDTVGLTYTVPGATQIKFGGAVPMINTKQSAVKVMDIFYIDYSNAASDKRFNLLQQRYSNLQKVRYVNSLLDTVKRCANRASTNRFWVISSRNDYQDFDFAWHAASWQSSLTHVFGTQWNKWSDTFLINRWEFERCSSWIKSMEQLPNLNFVADQLVHSPTDATEIYYVDHGNPESRDHLAWLQTQFPVVRTVRFFDSYLDTLSRLLDSVDTDLIWVISSLCDYSRFDFSWQPEAWQRDMLHVFPSQDQKFGDTFYVPVPKLREQITKLDRLEWFDTVNYCDDQTLSRWPIRVIKHRYDSHVQAIKQFTLWSPVEVFSNRDIDTKRLPTVSIWSEDKRTIIPLDRGAGAVIVPQGSIPKISTQFYDYAYIDKTHKDVLTDDCLDIVFISNGETNAEKNFQHLQRVIPPGKHLVHRVTNVQGRRQAYQAAAAASTTAWFFAVFAKLEINPDFDWNWLPDRMQQPKHYIFHALNPVNGLVYGHQAMIAYNKQMVLDHQGNGLDFTLDQPHEVIPLLSGTARYAEDPWMAWRTAFRECIKLRHSLPDIENEYRLEQWLDHGGSSDIQHWSRQGALDSQEFYDSVGGNSAELRKSFEWDWLDSFLREKHNVSAGQLCTLLRDR